MVGGGTKCLLICLALLHAFSTASRIHGALIKSETVGRLLADFLNILQGTCFSCRSVTNQLYLLIIVRHSAEYCEGNGARLAFRIL